MFAKKVLFVALFAALLFPLTTNAQLFPRRAERKAQREQTSTTCDFSSDGRCVRTKTDTSSTSEDAEMDAYLATQGYFRAADGTTVSPAPTGVPAQPVQEANQEALAVDEALASVEQKEAEWEAAKQDLEAAIEAEKRAALARSRAAEKEIQRLNIAHQAQIAKLQELLVDLEPTPAEE